MKICSTILKISMALLVALNFSACGGDDGPAAITYTGLTTPAVIDSDNADDLAIGAVQGGHVTNSIESNELLGMGAAVVQSQGSGSVGYPSVLAVSELLLSSLDQIDLSYQKKNVSVGEVTTTSETIYGTCEVGGSATFTGTYDDVSYEGSSKITYHDYCEDNIVVSGKVQSTSQFDFDTLISTSESSYDHLTVTNGVDSLTLDGDIAIVIPFEQPMTMTINLVSKDNNTQKVYKLENYVAVVDDLVDEVSAVVSGKYYDPDYGYVDISTESTFYRLETENHPYAGSLVVTGEVGASGGNAKARITVNDSTSYWIDVDADGDGTYEWHSDTIYWPVAE